MVEAPPHAAPPETAAALVERAARLAPRTVAVVSPEGREVTYAELVSESRRLGRYLLDAGLESGDRVAAWMDDCVEYVQVYVACTLAGLVVVPVNARFTVHEAHHLVTDSGARVLLHSAVTAERAKVLAADLLDLTVLGLTSPEAMADLLADQSESVDPLPAPQPGVPLVIGYTSGTTGRPKGAVLTQGSIAALARMNALSYRLPVGSVAAMTGSMAFVAVVPAHVFSHFHVRGTVRLLGAWTVPSLLDTIEQYRVTFTYIPSPLVTEFADAAEGCPERWESLETVLHSASKAAPDKLERLAAVIGGRLVEGWGMTENSGGLMTATTPADARPGTGRLATVGRPVAEVEVEVIDHDGRPLPHDGESLGELTYRSPGLMSGYWGLPDETARSLVDGWFRTGDLGSIDPDGYVTLTERRVDLIVSGGMNVYPFEVEQVLLRHPDVAACCVVGVPHDRWGQSVAAVVVRRAGASVTAGDLVEHCRTYLAGYKKPTRIEFVDALPTTSSLKVSRSTVRDMLR